MSDSPNSVEGAGSVRSINPDSLNKNPAFSNVVVEGNVRTVHIGGQDAVNASGEIDGKGDIAAQTEQVLANVRAALAAGGARTEHIIKWNLYIVEGQSQQAGFGAFQNAWPEVPNPPAITAAFVTGLAHPDFLVEMDAVAVVPQDRNDWGEDRATERDHRGSEPTAQPGTVGPRPDPLGLRRQGRHTPQCPDRVHLERRGDRHVHGEERPEAPGPTQEPDGCPDDRHRGAPAQDLAHPRSGRAGRRRWHPGRVSRDERHLRDDTRATGRVGGRRPLALRRHGPDHRDPDVGEADRLRDDSAERGRGATGPAAGRASVSLSAARSPALG